MPEVNPSNHYPGAQGDSPPRQPEQPGPDAAIPLMGRTYRLSELAVVLMVAALLIPAARYAWYLVDPTPAQLLVCISIALFTSVICLWLLDAISVIRFRSAWVSRSVYGAAIASVLGTSVGVYQGAFAERKYPLEGAWSLRIVDTQNQSSVADHSVLLIHSESADTYYGYSNCELKMPDATGKAAWLEVLEFNPGPKGKEGKASIRAVFRDGKEIAVNCELKSENQGKSFQSIKSDNTPKYEVTLSRPR